MPTSNLALARISGQPVTEEQIELGLVVDFPSGMGGTIKCVCTEHTANEAVFIPVNKEFPKWAGFKAEFNQPDFTVEDFEALGEAIQAFNSFGSLPTDEERAIVRRAQSLGYATNPSYTQAQWLKCGIEKHKALKAS